MQCQESQLHAHNDDVDLPEEVVGLYEQIIGLSDIRDCDASGMNSGGTSPGYTEGGQCSFTWSKPGRGMSTFDCHAKQAGIARLCYCYYDPNPTETVSSTIESPHFASTSPVTSAPVTSAPVTSAPVTSAPVTLPSTTPVFRIAPLDTHPARGSSPSDLDGAMKLGRGAIHRIGHVAVESSPENLKAATKLGGETAHRVGLASGHASGDVISDFTVQGQGVDQGGLRQRMERPVLLVGLAACCLAAVSWVVVRRASARVALDAEVLQSLNIEE